MAIKAFNRREIKCVAGERQAAELAGCEVPASELLAAAAGREIRGRARQGRRRRIGERQHHGDRFQLFAGLFVAVDHAVLGGGKSFAPGGGRPEAVDLLVAHYRENIRKCGS